MSLKGVLNHVQLGGSLLTIFCFLLVHIMLRPYRNQGLNVVQRLALVSQFFTVFGCLMFVLEDSEAENNASTQDNIGKRIVAFMIVFSNAAAAGLYPIFKFFTACVESERMDLKSVCNTIWEGCFGPKAVEIREDIHLNNSHGRFLRTRATMEPADKAPQEASVGRAEKRHKQRTPVVTHVEPPYEFSGFPPRSPDASSRGTSTQQGCHASIETAESSNTLQTVGSPNAACFDRPQLFTYREPRSAAAGVGSLALRSEQPVRARMLDQNTVQTTPPSQFLSLAPLPAVSRELSHPGHHEETMLGEDEIIAARRICSVAEDDDAVAAKYNYYNV